MSPKKILVFSLAYYPTEGGAEIALKEIISRIPEAEFDIITLCFDRNSLRSEKIGNATIYRLDVSKNLYPIKALFLATELHKSRNYETVWGIMANWAGLAALFFKLRFPQTKYLLTLQEGDSLSYIKKKTFFIYPIFKQIFLRADIIQAISKFLADWAREIGYKGPLEVVPNGVDTRKFSPNVKHRVFNKENVILITTSRLVEKNAVGDTISSLKFLPDNVSLKILGIGPLEKKLKSLVKKEKLDHRVSFFGHVPYSDVPKHLSESDIFVRPSLSEGFGSSFIEAMAIGLPVVATPVGGIVDFLEHEKTGLFSEVKNPESIARQVKRLIDDETLRKKIVEEARKMVEDKYNWDFIAEKIKSLVFDKV